MSNFILFNIFVDFSLNWVKADSLAKNTYFRIRFGQVNSINTYLLLKICVCRETFNLKCVFNEFAEPYQILFRFVSYLKPGFENGLSVQNNLLHKLNSLANVT